MTKGTNVKIYHEDKSVILDCTIGDDCIVHAPVWIGNGVKIGARCKIQAFSFLPEGVSLEDDVFVAPHVVFTNDPDLAVQGRTHWKPTLVKQGAKIGANASILAGVTIGAHAIVGMGAVVISDVPDNATVVGNPARQIYPQLL